jgi:hypothetical protein
MVFASYLVPVGVVGEERVCLGWRVINLCKTETIGHAEQLFVEACTTYYIDVLIG